MNIRFMMKTGTVAGFILLMALPLSVGAATSTDDAGKQKAGLAQEQRDKTTMQQISKEEDKQSAGEYLDDAGVTAKIKSKFLAQKGLDSLDIKVITVDGAVTLMGNVDNTAQVGLAENVAKDVEGVKKVDNQLTVKK